MIYAAGASSQSDDSDEEIRICHEGQSQPEASLFSVLKSGGEVFAASPFRFSGSGHANIIVAPTRGSILLRVSKLNNRCCMLVSSTELHLLNAMGSCKGVLEVADSAPVVNLSIGTKRNVVFE